MAMDNGQSTDWATVTTNGAAQDNNSSWVAALSGVALGVSIDRVLNNGQNINSSQGYGVNPDGSYYLLGQNNNQGAPVVAPRQNNNMILFILIGAFLLANK